MRFCQTKPAPASLLLVAAVLAPGKDMAAPGVAGVGPADHSDDATGSSGAVCSGSVPYGHVRPSGGAGCFAYQYRLGAEYLFLLNRVERIDGLTPYWIALGPTNEQINGADDPWVRWVREQLAAP